MDKHPIEAVLEHYGMILPYKRRGWIKVRCCFHDDGHASASVNFEENYFKCFACGVVGDVYDIIMDREGVNFVKAVEFAEGISSTGGITVQQITKRGRGVSKIKRANLGRRSSVLDGRGS